MTNNIIELRLPLKPDYLIILRGITGLAAGVALFNYEEIKQLRIAVSEVFDLAIKHATQVEQVSEVNELVVHLSPHPNRMEILIMGPKNYTSYLSMEEGMESLALLRSLVDEVEFGDEVIGKTLVRLIKYKSKAEASEERLVKE